MTPRRRAARRRRNLLLSLLAAFALFILFGFLGLPPIIKAQAEKRLTAALHRPVGIGRVQVNPFTLSLTLEDFAIREPDGREEFLGWDRLYVNFEILSLVTGEWHFAVIELAGPRVRVVVNRDGSLNFSDLLTDTAAAKKPGPAVATVRPVRIDRLLVTGARVDFQDLSRARPFATTLGPVGFSVADFRTVGGQQAPYSFEAVTESGEKFAWQGWMEAAPFRSGGELSVSDLVLKKYAPYYAEKLGVDLTDGRLTVRGRYDVNFGERGRVLKLLDGSLALRNLKLVERTSGAALLDLPAVDITGVTADGLTFKAGVKSVVLQGGHLRVRREVDGSLNLSKLTAPAAQTPNPPPAVPVAAPASAAANTASAVPMPDLRAGEITLRDWAVDVQDLAVPNSAQLGVTGVNFSLKNFSLAPGAQMPVTVALNWQPRGRIQMNGQVALQPVQADLSLDVDGLALLPLSPYFEQNIDARITEGAASVKGRATLALAEAQPPAATFDGEAWLEKLDLVTGTPGESFAGFSDLVLSGLKVATTPQLSVSLAELNLNAPYARVVMARDGRLNVAGLVRTPANPSAPSAPTAPVPTVTLSGAPAPIGPKIEVARVVINGGSGNFFDNSISPQVRLAVKDFGGILTGWSSANPGHGDAELKASVDGVGPVTIVGKFDPLGKDIFADAKVEVHHVDLLPVSPYVGKYAGYELSRGQLNLAVQAKIADRKLDVSNVVTLDQFTFGAATKSPDATGLPVRLGVALLKDLDGKIVLDVPVQGSLDDPDFKIGKVVWRVIGNLLVKAASSPFSLLGSMFGGGGDELGYQDFAPGSAALTPGELPKLVTLTKALGARPALSLGIEGGFDTTADAYALKRTKLVTEVRQAIWEEKHAKTPNIPPPALLEIKPEEQAAMVKKLFDRKFPPGTQFGTPLPPPPAIEPPPPRPPEGIVKRVIDFVTLRRQREETEFKKAQQKVQTDYLQQLKEVAAAGLPQDEMEGRLAEAETITSDELRALADARAQTVRGYLIDEGKIAAERLFLTQPVAPAEGETNAAATTGKGPRVFLQLQ